MSEGLFITVRGFPATINPDDPKPLRFVLRAFQQLIVDVENWAATVADQKIMTLAFTDSNVAAGVTNLQMRRVLSNGGGTGLAGKQMGVSLPYSAGLAAMMLNSDTALGAGTADFRLFADGNPIGVGPMTWSTGTKMFATYDPTDYVIGAGAHVDVRVTTSGGFAATGADIEIVCLLQRL